MTKWEYRITQEEVVGPSYCYTGGLDAMLNEWGQEGWELVAMIAEQGPPTAKYQQVTIYTCTFKRPIPASKEEILRALTMGVVAP